MAQALILPTVSVMSDDKTPEWVFNETARRAWLACAIDSEGNISLTRTDKIRKTPKYCAELRISNSDPRYIDRFTMMTKMEDIPYCGRSYQTAYSGNRKPRHQLHYGNKAMKKLLPILLPYFTIKRKQAILMLEALGLLHQHLGGFGRYYGPVNNPRLEILHQGIHKLNARGIKQ